MGCLTTGMIGTRGQAMIENGSELEAEGLGDYFLVIVAVTEGYNL